MKIPTFLKRLLILFLSSSLISIAYFGDYSYSAVPKAGSVCTKLGEVRKISNQTLKCTSQGKKKIWVKVVTQSTPTTKPSIAPTASPSSTPTATPTPTPTSTISPTPTPTSTISPTPTPTPKSKARSLAIYQGGGGSLTSANKSSELTFNPIVAPSDSNLKIWIYDPENQSRSLNSPGIFYRRNDGNWLFANANSDGTLYLKLSSGTYVFDTVEPNGNNVKYARRTYSLTVDNQGILSILGLAPNSLGIYTVTIDLRVASQAFVPKNQCQLEGQDGNLGMNSGFPHRSERLPTSGVIRALMIPIDFPDVTGSGNPAELYYDMANGMNEYYKKISDGQVSFTFQILPTYLRMTFSSTNYNLGAWSQGDSVGYYKAAIAAADPFVDYSKFDVVYILSPRNIPSSSIAYGPAFPIRVETNDGPIFNGSISGADAYSNFPGADWKWISHETGHLFGLHDLYTTDGQKATYGSWDLMSLNWSTEAIELNSWNRYISDWLKESQIDCLNIDALTTSGTNRTLIPIVENSQGLKAQFIRITSSKILVLEYRTSGGLDVIPLSNQGVLVYTVDMKVASIRGGWSTQRRPGSNREDFTDAALKSGDVIAVGDVKIEITSLTSSRADVKISKA